MNLCVLVATMNQTDLSLYKKMNLQTDAVIANQCGENNIIEDTFINQRIKMVSTDSKGVSKNRNIAFEHCFNDTDYVIFADDDLIFENNYSEIIEEEFQSHPFAEAIMFNIYNISSTRKITMGKINKFERCNYINCSSSGVCAVVIRKTFIDTIDLRFNEKFGPGSEYYCGEDSIFLHEMIRRNCKFYRSPRIIAGIDQTVSSWFDGINERNLTVRGMTLALNYPRMCYLIGLISAKREYDRRRSNLTFYQMLRCYSKGIKKIKKGDY